METIEDFYEGSKKHIDQFDAFAKNHELKNITHADHICYKCGSTESFEKMRAMFENESQYIYQSLISKRRIALIRFKREIETILGAIQFLELSDQKPDGSQQEGFDHIEVYPTTISYEEMVKKLETTEKVTRVERPHHTTHDIDIGEGFLFRCAQGPLIEKIKTSEMS